ncbi:hypothetical protein L9F63_005807 [Diploptera punctata]|uniref:Uncharacterized protein n=1 Tax=Diploptera punctata TaxID=6984 RepID=A0AAD7ZC24_DIPPU|nr:hypothetical protein L9F63_005807 [Diploptera punctata]
MGLENTSSLTPVSSILGLGGAFQKGLVFLLNLAWNSRFRLPVLITVGFMVLDVRMQLEINVDIEVRHVHVAEGDNDDDDDDDDDDDEDDDDDDDDEELDLIENPDYVSANESDSEQTSQLK